MCIHIYVYTHTDITNVICTYIVFFADTGIIKLPDTDDKADALLSAHHWCICTSMSVKS